MLYRALLGVAAAIALSAAVFTQPLAASQFGSVVCQTFFDGPITEPVFSMGEGGFWWPVPIGWTGEPCTLVSTSTAAPAAQATCGTYPSQAAAQAAYRADPIGHASLDGNDNDGIACEDRPQPYDCVTVFGPGVTQATITGRIGPCP